MRTDQFVGLLHKLRLGPASKRTAEAFGLSLPQLQRITGGESLVPDPVALLAIAYTKHGLPEPLWNPDVSRQDAIEDANSRMAELTKLFQKPATAVTEPVKMQAPVPAPDSDPAELVATARAAKLQRAEKANSVRMKRLHR